MQNAPTATAPALVAVEVNSSTDALQFLSSHPAVREITPGPEGAVVVRLDAAWNEHQQAPARGDQDHAPRRAPDLELHGPGAPSPALAAHPRAQYAETFFDGLGDPVFAPRGWWHTRLWLAPSI